MNVLVQVLPLHSFIYSISSTSVFLLSLFHLQYFLSVWFTNNLLKANTEKYHLVVSTNEKRNSNVGEVEISNSKCEKFLGIKIDSKLMFDSHVKSLCKKASQKLNALSRVAYQLDFNQGKLLMNALITSQFSYAPVV